METVEGQFTSPSSIGDHLVLLHFRFQDLEGKKSGTVAGNLLILGLSPGFRMHFALERADWVDSHSTYPAPYGIVGGVEQEVRVVYISACTGRDVSSVAATPS
jgi:hypothetical protein